MNRFAKYLTFWIPIRHWRHIARDFVLSGITKFIPLHNDWIIFYDTFSKSGNGDSIRPLANELKKEKPNMHFFFVSNTPRNIENADDVLIIGSKYYKYVMLRAKYMISPMDVPPVYKRPNQIWVMIWHGAPLKKIGLLRNSDKPMIEYVKSFQDCDYFCNTASIFTNIIKSAFDIPESMFINTGLPRNDILLAKDRDKIASRVRKKLNIPANKKIIFYCPTWRKTDQHQPMPFDIKKFKEHLGHEYVLMVRSHVGKHTWQDGNGNDIKKFNDAFIIDVADYNNLSELYLITDVFITDYSSAVFDFALLERPQILYAYDLEDYISKIGLTMDYYSFSPFPIAKTQSELIKEIKVSWKQDRSKLHDFRNKYSEFETGHATQKILTIIGLRK